MEMQMIATKEEPLEFTFGIHAEKLGDCKITSRIQIKIALMDLFDQQGVSIGHTDEELDQLHAAAERIQDMIAHGMAAADIKYDGTIITVSLNPLADLFLTIPEAKAQLGKLDL